MASKILLAATLALCCSVMVDAQQQPWDGLIWQKKIICFFNQYDINDDGLQDQADVDYMVNAYAPYGKGQQTAVAGLVNTMWKVLYAGKALDPHDVGDLEQSLETTGEIVMLTDVTTFVPAYFALLNTDATNNPNLTKDEWTFYFVTAQNMPSGVVSSAFTTFDLNTDNQVSPTEFYAGWKAYFTTSDPTNIYNNVLGQVN